MTRATTFYAVAPDGTVLMRASKTKVYTHAVLVRVNSTPYPNSEPVGEWFASSMGGWCGRLDLAEKQERRAWKFERVCSCVIVEVTTTDPEAAVR